ncbi:MAG: hypothetical protein GY842_23850 [bacterium]|nr:hypothetical protein [bacterium]
MCRQAPGNADRRTGVCVRLRLPVVLSMGFGLLLGMVGPAAGADYFVSPSGDDRGSGTRATPWKTIRQVNRALQPGDTATFLDGAYPGVIVPARSGAPGKPITYRSERPLGAVLTGGPVHSGRPLCVLLTRREHVVIEGFHLLPEQGSWMRLQEAHHCIIRGCRMERAVDSPCPFFCKDCNYNRYEDLWLDRSMRVRESGHVTGDMWNNSGGAHNLFLRIYFSRCGHRPFGMRINSTHNVVRQCVFDCRWGRNFEFFSTPRLLMEECVVTNGFNGSGSADGRAKLFLVDSIFRRNLVYRNYYGAACIASFQTDDLPPWSMTGSRLYHNTWVGNHEFGFQMKDFGALPRPHRVANNVLQNNIFAYNDPGGDGLALLLMSNIAGDNRFWFNDFYGHQPESKTVRYDRWGDGGERPALLMSAEEANARLPGQFRGNVAVDPGFVTTEEDDYRLSADSRCVDQGRPLAHAREAGSGRVIPVDDARWFYDGFGIPGERGDLVFIGSSAQSARVVEARLDQNVLVVDRDLSWTAGVGVTLPYVGRAPDLGAYERGAEDRSRYAGPRVPSGLRVETMATAVHPVVVTDFEDINQEEWFYYWNVRTHRKTRGSHEEGSAGPGSRSLCIVATEDESWLECGICPRWWDLARFPTVKFSYRIPKGVPVGVWVHVFRSALVGSGRVCLGGTANRKTGRERDLGRVRLVDDGQWHEATIDVRLVHKVFPHVRLLQRFRFSTERNARAGQRFWLDDFRILPGSP